ncbi:unnamed protein product [Scytosiphon promiscuus]
MKDGGKPDTEPLGGRALTVAYGTHTPNPDSTSDLFNGDSSGGGGGDGSEMVTPTVGDTQAGSGPTLPQPPQPREQRGQRRESDSASMSAAPRGSPQPAGLSAPQTSTPGGADETLTFARRQGRSSSHGDAAGLDSMAGEKINGKADDKGAVGDDAGGADGGGSTGDGEEKREIGWGPTSTSTFTSPPAEAKPSPGPDHAAFSAWSDLVPALAPAPDAAAKPSRQSSCRRSSSLSRYPSLPLLSAGPYLHKRGRGAAGAAAAAERAGGVRVHAENEPRPREPLRRRRNSRVANTHPEDRADARHAAERPGPRGFFVRRRVRLGQQQLACHHRWRRR